MPKFNETKSNDGAFVRWKICSIEPMNEEEAKRYQTNKGYMPMGYGFDGFKCKKEVDSEGRDYYIMTWSCYSSCE